MITLPESQGRFLLEAINLATLKLDYDIDVLTTADEGNVSDETSDLMNERDHYARLHDVVLAEVGHTVIPYRACPDSDCGWLNPRHLVECENCQGHI